MEYNNFISHYLNENYVIKDNAFFYLHDPSGKHQVWGRDIKVSLHKIFSCDDSIIKSVLVKWSSHNGLNVNKAYYAYGVKSNIIFDETLSESNYRDRILIEDDLLRLKLLLVKYINDELFNILIGWVRTHDELLDLTKCFGYGLSENESFDLFISRCRTFNPITIEKMNKARCNCDIWIHHHNGDFLKVIWEILK